MKLDLFKRHVVKSVSGVIFCLTSSASLPALSQTITPRFSISELRTGWSDDSFGIATGGSIQNPASCQYPDTYVANVAQPGYKTYLVATLMAFAAGKQISVVVSNTDCMLSRPKVIGVYVEQ